MAFDEARHAQVRLGSQDRGVESLEVSNLKHAPLPPGEVDELACLLGSLGDGLLDQHVGTSAQEVARNGKVRRRRCHDADRVHGPEQLAIVRKTACRDLRPNGVPRLLPGVDDGYQLAAGDLRIFLCVEAAEIADSDDGSSDFLHGEAIMPQAV